MHPPTGHVGSDSCGAGVRPALSPTAPRLATHGAERAPSPNPGCSTSLHVGHAGRTVSGWASELRSCSCHPRSTGWLLNPPGHHRVPRPQLAHRRVWETAVLGEGRDPWFGLFSSADCEQKRSLCGTVQTHTRSRELGRAPPRLGVDSEGVLCLPVNSSEGACSVPTLLCP